MEAAPAGTRASGPQGVSALASVAVTVRKRSPLGRDYRRLWAANAVSVTGDGVTVTAGPLLAASITHDPLLVAGALFAQQLPWLIFALLSGALVDRLEPDRLIVIVDLLRAAAVGGLAASVLAGTAHLAALYGALFILGAGSTVSDTAALSLPPLLVGTGDLVRANAGLQAVQLVGADLVGPPLGACLFVLAAGMPFAFDAATFVAGAALIAGIRRRRTAAPVSDRPGVRREIAEGIRWLLAHPGLRMLAAAICVMNIMLGSTLAILVLYVRVRLGLGAAGYGVLLACSAAGGVIGTIVVKHLLARFDASSLLRTGLIIECATHVSLALTRRPWVAALTLVIFGVHNGVWNVVTVTLRQTAVPGQLRGRVNSVYYTFAIGGFALGSVAGGLLARGFGLTAPFWVAAAAVAVVAMLAWRLFTPGHLATQAAASASRARRTTRSAPRPLPRPSSWSERTRPDETTSPSLVRKFTCLSPQTCRPQLCARANPDPVIKVRSLRPDR
jgi:MFS family permease